MTSLRPTPLVGLLALALPIALTSCASGSGGASDSSAGSEEHEVFDPARSALFTEWHAQFRDDRIADRRFKPEDYWAALSTTLEGSDRLTVAEVGRSVEGRPLQEVRFGHGPTPVLLWSQMHGDESTASMALLDLFRFLASDTPLASRLEERLSIHVIPVLNPDGATRFQRRNAVGIDVNRDARNLSTPEGQTLKAVHDRVQPQFAFNLHDQNVRTRVGSSDRGAAISLLAPAFNLARDVNPTRERAMRIASAIASAVEPLVGDHVTRYNDAFNPRAFGDLISAWGASAVLIESGGWLDDPQKQHLRKANFVGLLAALEVIAEERWNDFTPRRYEALPPNGRAVDDLLLTGGILAIPGFPEVPLELQITYDRPLLFQGARIGEIGDLGGFEARDTINLAGAYLIPMVGTVDRDGALRQGSPARFLIARDPGGLDVIWRFDGELPMDRR